MSGLTTRDVSKSYGSKRVLNDLSFSVPAGQTTLLAGLNGAGKTTWIRAALGLTSVDAGSIEFDHQNVRAARKKISVVFDEPPIYPTMSGADNLIALSGNPRVSPAQRRSVCDMLALTSDFLAMKGKAYSLGQRRRLAVAVALLRQPDYLFLDEPTIGLDPVAWSMMRTCITQLAESGCAVVLTGQDFDEFTGVVEHVAVLHEGRALFEGPSEELLRQNPPRVWIDTPTPHHDALAAWEHVGRGNAVRVEKSCASLRDAETLLASVRSLELPITGMGIRNDSLEEAFLSLVQADR